MTKLFNKQLFKQIFFITLGCSIYAFSLDAISILTNLPMAGLVVLPFYFGIGSTSIQVYPRYF